MPICDLRLINCDINSQDRVWTYHRGHIPSTGTLIEKIMNIMAPITNHERIRLLTDKRENTNANVGLKKTYDSYENVEAV